MSTMFNPVTSTKAKLVEKLCDGSRIYSHTARGIAGKFVVSDETGFIWTACDTMEEAHNTLPGYGVLRLTPRGVDA